MAARFGGIWRSDRSHAYNLFLIIFIYNVHLHVSSSAGCVCVCVCLTGPRIGRKCPPVLACKQACLHASGTADGWLASCRYLWQNRGGTRASLVREEGELRHSPGCGVAPSAELARSVTLCMSADAQRGSRCLLRHSLPIADVLVFDVCRPLERAVFPAIDSKSRNGCVCWGIYVYVSWHGALSLSFESCPEIKQGYPLNLSI